MSFLYCILLSFLPRNSERARRIRCEHDLHDWYDDEEAHAPMHMCDYNCQHCGKTFTI